MAAKKRSRFVCTACGHDEPKWLGRCPACGNWNTFEETESPAPPAAGGARRTSATTAEAMLLENIRTQDALRVRTGLSEFDRVLGGGASLGSSTLIGGEPGIGKSTLLLQAAGSTSDTFSTLYVTGEEAAGQLKQRADRLGVRGEQLHILANANLSLVLRSLEKVKPDIIVIDSVQTLYTDEAAGTPGSPAQLRYCTFEIADWARNHSAVCFFVAHVTKDGAIAGPKVMEHMVDTVLLFEEAEGSTRILRATKNRFGATDEIGLFSMAQSGLKEVSD
ncbi:MAG: ATPase domain-containing protein, partial [bacterium]